MTGAEASPGILTFLIADIRGYTTFTQERGDEAAGRLAGKFAEVTRAGVAAHGGEVTELRGDEALAVFSSPRGALRAAADLQMVYADEGALEPHLPLRVGVGIDAGEAVPVAGGYRGGALNLAARLCSRAAAGEVLVSQGLAHLAGRVEGIRLEQHGEMELKGLNEPVRVFRAVADRPVLAAPSTPRGELPIELDLVAPIIGREQELGRLRWMWRLARRGGGAVAAVVGPPGIGKTRLVAALAATVAAGGGRARYRCFADAHDETVDAQGAGGDVPQLTVLDDVDCASDDGLAAVARALAGAAGTPALVLLAYDDQRASPQLLTTLHRLVGADATLRPPPLALDEMLQVAALYLGAAADALPRDLLTSTGGIPRRVHEEVSSWAQAHATRRLGALADQAAAGRSDLRSLEADLAGSVIDLQLVREQTRLFGVGPGRHAAEATRPPYPGLVSFDVGDADLFFGRERLVAELIARLAGAPLLGVLGPSGSGKSSAVSAGLVPALASGVLPGSENWTLVRFRPGEHPLRALDRALFASLPRDVVERLGSADAPLLAAADAVGPDGRVAVIIDQFEEVFTACQGEQERTAFLDALVHAADDPRRGVVVVAAIRADYYGRCAVHARLADLLGANHVLVGSMTADEYRRAITQPALKVGALVEPELVDDLVSEVLGEPGALPLLSTAMLELWMRRDGRTMRRRAYLATGGVRGAVARLAEDVYNGMDRARQAVARSILLRLAGPGEGDAVVGARVPLSEFDAQRDETVAQVLDELADRRLVTVSEGAVEVAHEALLREWPRLREWLDEDREGRRLHGHLIVAAREWMERDRDPAELYRGPRLSAALDWTTGHALDLNEREREFVTASRAASQRDLVRRQRQNRRLRVLLAGVVGMLVVAIVAGSVAVVQRRSAQDQARVALARQLGAEALSAPRIDQALLLARQAVLLDDSPQTAGTLLATLLRSPAVIGTFTMPINLRPLQLALSPDGQTLAVAANNGDIRFFDTRRNRESRPPLTEYGGFPAGTMTFAGRYLVAPHAPASGPPTLDVLDAQTMRRVRGLPLSPDFLNSPTARLDPVVASPDGQTVYFAWALQPGRQTDGPAFLDRWDVATGAHRLVPLGSNGISGAAALPGNRLMVVTDTAAITLDGATLATLSAVPVSLTGAAASVSPDGRTLVSRAIGGGPSADSFSIIDLASGRVTPASVAHSGGIDDILFTPDGGSVVTIADDGRAIVWDVATGAPTQTLSGHSGRVVGEAVSADGRTLYTASLDGAIFGWDLGGTDRFGRPFTSSTAPPPRSPAVLPVPALAVSPDSSRLATRVGPGRVGIVSLSTLHRDASFGINSGDDVAGLAWSSRQQIAVIGGAGVELWDVRASPLRLRTLTGVAGTGDAVAVSPDGRLVAAVTVVPPPPNADAPADGWLGVWDADTGQVRARLHLGVMAMSLSFDAAGRLLAVGTQDGNVLLVDAQTGHTQRTLRPQVLGQSTGPVGALAFRDDGTLLTGSNAGIVQHWDTQTGAELEHAVLVEAAPVAGIAMAPGGATFSTSGGSAGGVKIWDDASLQQFGATLPGGEGRWGAVRYTPDGTSIVAVYDDGSAAVWPVSLAAWMDHACAVARRNFTSEEWLRFVPDHDYAQTCPALSPG